MRGTLPLAFVLHVVTPFPFLYFTIFPSLFLWLGVEPISFRLSCCRPPLYSRSTTAGEWGEQQVTSPEARNGSPDSYAHPPAGLYLPDLYPSKIPLPFRTFLMDLLRPTCAVHFPPRIPPALAMCSLGFVWLLLSGDSASVVALDIKPHVSPTL